MKTKRILPWYGSLSKTLIYNNRNRNRLINTLRTTIFVIEKKCFGIIENETSISIERFCVNFDILEFIFKTMVLVV